MTLIYAYADTEVKRAAIKTVTEDCVVIRFLFQRLQHYFSMPITRGLIPLIIIAFILFVPYTLLSYD